MNSSPLGLYPAILGTATADGKITLAVCSVTDPECDYSNVFRPADVSYTFRIAVSPVPLPGAVYLFLSGLAALGFFRWRVSAAQRGDDEGGIAVLHRRIEISDDRLTAVEVIRGVPRFRCEAH